jgi:radial spoke head protein 1|uniref:Uncharacterized protein n=1 Tax=Eutreptiella gymnastica TaxID=73025 RepID=A0A7S4GBG3_9EUGL|mmetsp:Transcript_49966/g.82374  ORF Transcript_49966/g.82374 Transcript_49966/m.82374 type:complete len:679 (+) Transcript_49966:47-2083(+)|eukprot:CAMPEP_0174285888 /NCGR_PEP_ID=MMETSP0809-20121228/9830_1 /TAXON_ID=73025 ORGANISM="Eutreptiella gymnastica-like, Strain CCMP1594" /NCGR_SAMPLE_ID=MMETSP0809 /ASSEMBLY_ACC=CAM_ASM_000658 /LENGTH=678 /DNA_ID=CAMNT_0015381773 /DNA_START=46 /DNA_END=2082 /DNA_ORIENTATION=-
MSDDGDEDKSQAGGDEGEEEFNLPELWKYATQDKVGKIVKYLNSKEEEELPEAVQEANPENGQSLLMWATLKQRFVLVEWLIKKCKRDGFAFRDKTSLGIYDKWVEERKAKEERDKEAAEEAAARAAEGEADEEEEEEKEPEPEMYQTIMDGMEGEEGVDVFVVRRIGELGVYEGGRDSQGNKTGLGQTIFVNGDMYIGEFVNNKREGTGTYFWTKTGLIYTGQWKNNQRSGLGRMVYADGGRYYGQWLLDKKNGKGRYTYPNGDTYNGDWEDDKKEGFGTYIFACDSSQYTGTYRSGEFTSGKWLMSGNTTYFGVFKNFKPISKGVFIFNGKFKQEGEYKGGKWVPVKVQNIKGDDEVDLLITVQGNRVRLRYTPEMSGSLKSGIEQLVSIVNFKPFEQWQAAVEGNRKMEIRDIRVRSLNMEPDGLQIKSVRLQVDAYDATVPKAEQQKLPMDTVTLQTKRTVVVVIVSFEGKQYYLGVQSPDMTSGNFECVDLPCGTMDSSGVFRGPEVDKIAKVFDLSLHRHSMMDFCEMCFADSSRALLTSPHDHTGSFNMWLYKQVVHADYFNTLPDRLARHNKEGDMVKAVMYEASEFANLVTSTRGSTALMLIDGLANRMPLQTVAPQRPPTPPPPEPEPVPIYTEEELAAQAAALEAEQAAKRKPAEEEEKAEEEEEED